MSSNHHDTPLADLPEFDEPDYVEIEGAAPAGEFLPSTNIEILRNPPGRGRYRHALFDFDGTLSLIRSGWTDVMVSMMVEILLETGTGEPEEQVRALVSEFVDRLTGKQTIFQMMRLAEEVKKRGVEPLDPSDYKSEYLRRLLLRIDHRRRGLREKSIDPAELMVSGSLELLRGLRKRGVQLYLASGTDEHYVIEEAELLGLDEVFGEHIYGAREDYRSFSKAKVTQWILSHHGLGGDGLMGFGDGYVEIANLKAAGSAAVGVASDEEGRSPRADRWKRERLVKVGADVIVPDYAEAEALLGYLLPGEEVEQ